MNGLSRLGWHAGPAGDSSGTIDVVRRVTDQGTFLYTLSANGTLTAYELGGDGAWTRIDTASVQMGLIGSERLITIDGEEGRIGSATELTNSGQLVRLRPDGNLGGDQTLVPAATFFSGITSFATTEVGGQRYALVAQGGGAGLSVFTIASDLTLSPVAQGAAVGAPEATLVAGAMVGDTAFALSLDATTGLFVVAEMDAAGLLTERLSFDANSAIGLSDITRLEVVEQGGQTFVLLAAAGTHSLSVMQLSPSGALTLTDHVMDDLTTRFGGVTALDTLVVGEEVYVAAGGADDGVALFRLLPNGRLVHLGSLADSLDMSLENVSGISLGVSGATLTLSVVSASETGVTRVGWDRSGTGQTLIADDGGARLIGGSLDDIVMDGVGQDSLVGGSGADLFILSADDTHDVIEDFDPTQDRLDLSSWVLLRSTAQITFTPTAYGALLTYRGETLELRLASGTSLDEAGFLALDVVDLDRFPLPTLPDPPPEPGVIKGTVTADLLTGTAEDETVYGYAGNDTIRSEDGDDLVYGDDGDDLINGATGRDTIYGGAGADRIFTFAGNDLLYGEGGADVIESGAGQDTLFGGPENDTLRGGDDPDQLDGGDGDDLLNGGSGADIAVGGEGNDTLYGHNGDDRLEGGPGNDLIEGAGNNDSLYGGAGDDLLRGLTQDDYLSGGVGNDTLNGWTGQDTLLGDGGQDTMWGWDGDDLMQGGDGDDRIDGHFGNDTLWGEVGNDTLYGQADDDVLDCGVGNDFLEGGDGNDTVHGDAGNDLVRGNLGDDSLTGGAGFDLLNGAEGADILRGDGENDSLYGGAGLDTLYGGANEDLLSGGTEADQLWGEAGNDLLRGDEGDDLLDGGTGADTLNGGSGNDTLIGGEDTDTLYGQDGHDSLSGGASADLIEAGAGDDMAQGGFGADTLLGGAGNDTLLGDGGDDRLVAGEGMDRLEGGAGADTLLGGADADVFVFAEGSSWVEDFGLAGDLDQVDLSAALGIIDFADLTQSHLQQVGGNLMILDEAGNTMTLVGVSADDISSLMFLF